MSKDDVGATQARSCSICKYLPGTFIPHNFFQRGIITGSQYDKLRASSFNGCFSCRLLIAALNITTNDPEKREDLSIQFSASLPPFRLFLFKETRAWIVDVSTGPETTNLPNIRQAPSIPQRTNLDENLPNIKR